MTLCYVMLCAIQMLGGQVAESGRNYTHWISHGVYPFGIKGTKAQPPMPITNEVITNLKEIVPEINHWMLTDTTPAGFTKVFMKKVDTTPTENHAYLPYQRDCYRAISHVLKQRGYKLKTLTKEEILIQANKKGAPGVTDNVKNVQEFLNQPDWEQIVEQVENDLLSGRPTHAIWSTMGKREKKKMVLNPMGSRMIAYLPIAMRIIELKYLGDLIRVTKPDINDTGVGAVGLHDLGEMLQRKWIENAVSDDIAGWDTRVSATMQDMEHEFIQSFEIPTDRHRQIITCLYRLYKYPHILIPMESEFIRSELLSGFGQRMSGAGVTYTMNTISRLSVLATTLGIALEKMPQEIVEELMTPGTDINAMISGDDCTLLTTSDIVQKYATSFDILNEMGMIRKDIPLNTKTPIDYKIEDVSFCSHSYERITYYDSWTGRTIYRYMPTRNVYEIIGEATMWSGMKGGLEGELAWMTTQGSNLLACYHHLRLPRLLGLCFKGIAPDNLLLTDEGPYWKRTPWLTPGDTLDIINRVLFGESTLYPQADFKVRDLSHLGYLPINKEQKYMPMSVSDKRVYRRWKVRLSTRVHQLAHRFGGDISYLAASDLLKSF